MPQLNFTPSRHGFHFANNFTNQVGPFTTYGLCGGMALACFNYYRNGMPIPTHKPADFGTADGVPPDGSRLRNYIFSQQIGSFASAGGFFLPNWPWESDDDVLRNQYRASLAEFDRVKAAINFGRFVLLGLRSSQRGNLLGHQVLAYGYDEARHGVYIYDSNYPDEEMVVEADAARERVVHKYADGRPSSSASAFGSFFVQLELDPMRPDLFTDASRPTYADFGIQTGLVASRPVGDGLRQVGERLEMDALVRNYGDYPARAQALLLWARDPHGRNRDADLGRTDSTRVIPPGQVVRLNTVFDHFGEEAGSYRFGVSYLSEHNHWISVPVVGADTRNTLDIELVAGADTPTDHGDGGYAGPGTYYIRARHSGKVLDVNIDFFSGQNNGRPVSQVDLNHGDHQKFAVEALPDGFVRFRARHSGKCIEVTGVSTDHGVGLQQWEWNGGHNQQFRIEPIGDCYRIMARHSGLFFDIAGQSLDNGARLTQWSWWAGNNQLFQFIRTA